MASRSKILDVERFKLPSLMLIIPCSVSGHDYGRNLMASGARSVLSRLLNQGPDTPYSLTEEDIAVFEQVKQHLRYQRDVIFFIYSGKFSKDFNPSRAHKEYPIILAYFTEQSGQKLGGIERLLDAASQLGQGKTPVEEKIRYLDNYLQYLGRCLTSAITARTLCV